MLRALLGRRLAGGAQPAALLARDPGLQLGMLWAGCVELDLLLVFINLGASSSRAWAAAPSAAPAMAWLPSLTVAAFEPPAGAFGGPAVRLEPAGPG